MRTAAIAFGLLMMAGTAFAQVSQTDQKDDNSTYRDDNKSTANSVYGNNKIGNADAESNRAPNTIDTFENQAPPSKPLPIAPPANPTDALLGVPADAEWQLKNKRDYVFKPAGFGWCIFTESDASTTYFSDVFAGDPSQDTAPRADLYTAFIHRIHPDAKGSADCVWSQWDPDYILANQEKSREFNEILKSHAVVRTGWRPDVR